MEQPSTESVKLGYDVNGAENFVGEGVLVSEHGQFSQTATVVLESPLNPDDAKRTSFLLSDAYLHLVDLISLSEDRCQAEFRMKASQANELDD